MQKKFITQLFAVSVFVSFGAICVCSQEKTGMSADQTLRSNARVNPSTLGMELSIPLAAYPGRGPGASVSLSYSSKLWRMQNVGTVPIINNPGCRGLSIPRFAELSASGWTTDSATPYIEYTGLDNPFDDHGKPINEAADPCAGTMPESINHIRRIIVHMPGGGTHELRASTDLIIHQSAVSYNITNVNSNGFYYATDGSNLIYEQDSATSTYRLYLPDGSRLDFGQSHEYLNTNATQRTIRKAAVLRDRNGNKITYHAANPSHPNGYVTDTMGRIIDIPIGLAAPLVPTSEQNPQQYTVPGMTGSSGLTYGLHWKRLADVLTNPSDNLCYLAAGFPYLGSPQPPAGTCRLFNSVSGSWVSADPALGAFNPIVLGRIDLPNGNNYRFHYDIYGRIDKIEYPTGAIETFDYSVVPALAPRPIATSPDVSDLANFGVTYREVVESPSATPIGWNYAAVRQASPSLYMVTTDAPDGTKTEVYLNQGNTDTRNGFDSPIGGMPYEERFYDSSDNLRSKKLSTQAMHSTAVLFSPGTIESHPRVAKVESIVYDGSASLSSSVTTSHAAIDSIDDPLLPVVIAEYAFTTSIGGLGSLQRTTETDYVTDHNYTIRNLRSLASETRIKDASGNVKAKSQIGYDGESLLTDGSSTRWENPNTLYCGNVTSTKSWSDIAANQFVETRAQYDQLGNLRNSWDARGYLTQTAYSPTYDHAYPTSVTTPAPDPTGVHGSNTGFTTSTVYDFNTGLPTSATDINGQTSTTEYNDPMLRPTKVTAPNGHQTITEYGAGTSAAQRFVKTRSQIDETNWKEGFTWYDGLMRTVRSQSVDDDGDVFALTCYDNMSRVSKVTNPFRGYTTQDCTTTAGLEWKTNTFDTAGRPWKVTTPDNAVVETTYSLSTSGSQIGTVVTVKDQALKERRSITNALGQLTRVDEPDASGNLGSTHAPNQPTNYAYDTLNNLTTVSQGVQTRTFAYNGLSLLTSATNPESGTINYLYDSNGNLTSKTDARGVRTDYVYDSLNRVTNRNYSTPNGTPGTGILANYQATPNVSYFYDGVNIAGGIPNSKGKLTKVTSSVSTTEYAAFDILGRATRSKQITDGVAYTTGYTYNLSGALIEETYPSGRVVKNTLSSDGDLQQVQSRKSNGTLLNYANAFNYNAAGAVTSIRLGNGRWENTTFNSRLQPTQIGLGGSATNTSLLKLNYDYGTTDNNGNVKSQTITVPTVGENAGFTAVQSYTYDSLNRLKSATENINGSQTPSWKQTYTFDRYGNRRFDVANTTTIPAGCAEAVCNPQIDPATNKLIGYVFDTSGNTTTDANGQTFTYDGENKQVQVNNDGGIVGQYFYNPDGQRIKKIVPSSGETTIFVYDASNKLIGEYSTIVEPQATAKTSYLTNDHLGSPRITTDALGQVISRRDFLPFGEEIARTGNGSDSIRQKFTGYERDTESVLDYAQERMLCSSIGRFMTPDPYNIIFEKDKGKDADEKSEIFIGFVSNPQRWNIYIYVVNNPLAFIDPDGRNPQTINIFVGLANKDGMKEWEDFAKKAREKGFTVNIYKVGQEGGQANDFLNSLKAKDTVTIFAGHSSTLPNKERVGIHFNGGDVGVNGKLTNTADGVDIKNDIVAVFSCGFGKAFNNITSSNGAAFVWIAQGSEPATQADAVNGAALRFAKSIVELSGSSPIAPDTILVKATSKATTAMTAFGRAPQNDGDIVKYRILPKKGAMFR